MGLGKAWCPITGKRGVNYMAKDVGTSDSRGRDPFCGPFAAADPALNESGMSGVVWPSSTDGPAHT